MSDSRQVDPYAFYQVNKPLDREHWSDVLGERFWRYRRKWEENPQRFVVEDFPLHVGIEVTTACNLACPFCYRTKMIRETGGLGRPIIHMEMALVRKIVDEGGRHGLCAVGLNGLGEPLLHPDIVHVVEHCRGAGVVDVMFHTNGLLLSKRMSEDLIRAGLTQLIVSLDSGEKAEYERLRRKSSFDRVMANLEVFFEARQRLGRKLPFVRVTMILQPETSADSVERFRDRWQDQADMVTFQQAIEIDLDSIHNHPPPPEALKADFVCAHPWQRVSISVEGDLAYCCWGSNFPGKYTIGNVRAQSIAELWHGAETQRVRRLMRAGRILDNPLCRTCGLVRR